MVVDTKALKIVPLEKEMQDSVRDLITEGLVQRWGYNDPNLNPDLKNIALHYGRNEMFVAFLNDRIVGAGAIVKESEHVGRVVRMSVLQTLRGHGIGTRILRYLESVASARGFQTVVLETTATWEDAIGFYQSQGYEIVEVADGDAHFTKRV